MLSVSALALFSFQCKTGDVPPEPVKVVSTATAPVGDAGVANACGTKRQEQRIAIESATREVSKILGNLEATESNDIPAAPPCQRPDDDTRGGLVKAFEELARKQMTNTAATPTVYRTMVGCADPEGIYVHGAYSMGAGDDAPVTTTIARTSSPTSTTLTVVATVTTRPKAIDRIRIIEAADIDGDGKRDVVVAEEGPATLGAGTPIKLSVITAQNQRIRWTGEPVLVSDNLHAVLREGGGSSIVRAKQNVYRGDDPEVRVLNLVKGKLVQDDELARAIAKRLAEPVASIKKWMSYTCVDK